jgi:peptide/nickel transport system substrate-binding protein
MKPNRKARTSGRRRGIAFALVAALAVAACGGSDDASESADDSATEETAAPEEETAAPEEETAAPEAEAPSGETKTTLTIVSPQEPASWNYYEVAANALRVPTFKNVQETVVELNTDGTITPMLAESWEVSADGLVYTFKIRSGVKFHDGSDLDSADVKYSMEINAKSPNSKLSAAHANVASVEAPDANTVVITLKQVSSTFLKELGMSPGYVVPENFLTDQDPNTTMIGTGPWSFGEYLPDTSLTLNRFADYWGEAPFFDTLVWLFIDDETASLNGLLASEYDLNVAVLAEGIERVDSFETDPNFTVTLQGSTENSYMWLNVNDERFQDIRVRQAIAHAINREEAIAVYNGDARPTCLMVMPDSEPYNSDYCPYPFDPEKSKALLKEAGYEGLEIDYPFVTVASHPFTMEVLTQQLAAAGITVKSRGEDLTTWLDKTWTKGNYEMSEIRDSASILQFGCEGGREPLGKSSSLCIPEFEEKLAKADAFLNYDDHLAAMSDLAKTFADLAWVNAIAAVQVPMISRVDLTGVPAVRINDGVDLRKARWGN